MPHQTWRTFSEQGLVGATSAELLALDSLDLIRVVTASVDDNSVHELLPVQAFTRVSRGSTVLESSPGCRSNHDLTQVEVVPVWALFSGGAATAGFSG